MTGLMASPSYSAMHSKALYHHLHQDMPRCRRRSHYQECFSPPCRLVSHPSQPLHTEKSVQDPELQALLATSLKKKKPSKKKQAKEAEKATPMEQ